MPIYPSHARSLPSLSLSRVTAIVTSLAMLTTGCSPNGVKFPGLSASPQAASPTVKPSVKPSVKPPVSPTKPPAKSKAAQSSQKQSLTATDLNNRGVDKIEKSNYNSAIQDFNQALKLDPKAGESYLNRGLAYSSLGNKQQAIADFRQAITRFKQQGDSANARIAQVNLETLDTPEESPSITASTVKPAANSSDSSRNTASGQSAEMALANHLRSVGAKMYGAYWCAACNWQQSLFYEASHQLEVIECDPRGANAQPDRCQAAGLRAFPTWEINGRVYPPGALALGELADLSNYRGPRNFR